MSLSSRRAWIEITQQESSIKEKLCRSPHGERGLKLKLMMSILLSAYVALLTESVD